MHFLYKSKTLDSYIRHSKRTILKTAGIATVAAVKNAIFFTDSKIQFSRILASSHKAITVVFRYTFVGRTI